MGFLTCSALCLGVGLPLFDRGASDWQVSVPPSAARPVNYAAAELTKIKKTWWWLAGSVLTGFSLLAADPLAAWPKEADPEIVSRRVTEQFLRTRPERYCPPGYCGNGYCNDGYGFGVHVQYSVVSIWANALDCARKTGNLLTEERLIRLYDDFLPGGPLNGVCSRPYHVDDTIFGAVPLEIYLHNRDRRCLDEGLRYADTQWTPPCAGTLAERHAAPKAVQEDYWKRGYTPQTRLWIDDMYMIIALQSQAYRATGKREYIDRAAKEMGFYLDELQLKDGSAKGLFYHAPDVHYVWGRGDGWMAAAMAMVLKFLPADSEYRPRILEGYRLMMAALLKYQRADGFWSQLVDAPNDPANWPESSCTAMFAYAFITGVKSGWLDRGSYGPAARKAWIALCRQLDAHANVPNVCCGTGKKDDRPYYFARTRVHGDPHGQAPMLWCCAALLEQPVKRVGESRLFDRVVDAKSGCVSYQLRPGSVMFNQQSYYFTAKSMTDDGRFLLFHGSQDERTAKALTMADGNRLKQRFVIDLLTDEIRRVRSSCSYLDVKTGFVYGFRDGALYRHDLRRDDESEELVAKLPADFVPADSEVVYYWTGSPFDVTGTYLFMDSAFRQLTGKDAGKCRFQQGVINVRTGVYEKWTETDFCVDHGQLNPVDPTLALGAWENCWSDKKRFGDKYRDVYPRMWLFRKGKKELVPNVLTGGATHEHWAADGKSFHWCDGANAICRHVLATGKQEIIVPHYAGHADVSPDNRYVVYDACKRPWFRGCGWDVGFYDTLKKKNFYFQPDLPPVATKEQPSVLHPDPHPQFVMNGRYVVNTRNDSEGRLNLSVTPVAELVERLNTIESLR